MRCLLLRSDSTSWGSHHAAKHVPLMVRCKVVLRSQSSLQWWRRYQEASCCTMKSLQYCDWLSCLCICKLVIQVICYWLFNDACFNLDEVAICISFEMHNRQCMSCIARPSRAFINIWITFWGGTVQMSRLHWLSYKTVCSSKLMGTIVFNTLALSTLQPDSRGISTITSIKCFGNPHNHCPILIVLLLDYLDIGFQRPSRYCTWLQLKLSLRVHRLLSQYHTYSRSAHWCYTQAISFCLAVSQDTNATKLRIQDPLIPLSMHC